MTPDLFGALVMAVTGVIVPVAVIWRECVREAKAVER